MAVDTLSARDTAVAVGSLIEPTSSVWPNVRGSSRSPTRAAKRCATSTRRTSASGAAQLAAMSSYPAGEPGRHNGCPSCVSNGAVCRLPRSCQPSPRIDETVHSHGVLNFTATGDHASCESINAR